MILSLPVGSMRRCWVSDEALTVEAIVAFWRTLKQQEPQPVRWTITMSVNTYRHLWNVQKPMRKKLQRMRRDNERRFF